MSGRRRIVEETEVERCGFATSSTLSICSQAANGNFCTACVALSCVNLESQEAYIFPKGYQR